MADIPIPISDISDPSQIRVKLLASGKDVHAPMGAVASASIHGASAKTTPVDADEFPLADSADSYAVKKVTWANIKATIWTALGSLINGGTGKTTPVDADMFAIADSAASNATKKLTWANVKATLVATANTWSAVQTFSAIPVLSGGAISFPATQVASAGANDLDDYEEGTWTPVLTFVIPGNLSVAYTTQTGRYTKIGRLVMLELSIATSTFTWTTASGLLNITGMPFAPGGIGLTSGSMDFQGITKAGFTQFIWNATAGTTALRIFACGTGATRSAVAAADMPSGGSVVFQGQMVYSV